MSNGFVKVPYSNNFLKVSFKGTGEVLVEIIFGISRAMSLYMKWKIKSNQREKRKKK